MVAQLNNVQRRFLMNQDIFKSSIEDVIYTVIRILVLIRIRTSYNISAHMTSARSHFKNLDSLKTSSNHSSVAGLLMCIK